MRKEIRLLVENFFDDDDIFKQNDINQDIQDIGDQYYNYQVGDIYYENNKPYAVCCGDKSQFKNNHVRFCLLNIDNLHYLKWKDSKTLLSKLPCIEFPKNINIFTNKECKSSKSVEDIRLDENGYENTQIIKKFYKKQLITLEAFNYCIEQGDNVYLPAIDELIILFSNLKKEKFLNSNISEIWSSTQCDTVSAALYYHNTSLYSINQDMLFSAYKTGEALVIPFLYI